MEKYFLLALLFFFFTSAFPAQNRTKKKLKSDSSKSKSDFLPRIPFSSLDSLKQQSLLEQKKVDGDVPDIKIQYNMPMVKPDPNVRYNMPMYSPNSGTRYYMPMYKGPDNSTKGIDTLSGQKDTHRYNLRKAPKKNNKGK